MADKLNGVSVLKWFFQASTAYLLVDDDELVDKKHIVAAAKQRFGVSQELMDISEEGMMKAREVMRTRQRSDGCGEDREEHRSRNEES